MRANSGRIDALARACNEKVPRDMVHNRISEFESMIQKSKSMPNLGDECLIRSSCRRASSPKRASLLSHYWTKNHQPEILLKDGPQYPKINTHVPIHIQVTSDQLQNSTMQHDYSDSEHDAVVSDLSDFIQIEGSSFCRREGVWCVFICLLRELLWIRAPPSLSQAACELL